MAAPQAKTMIIVISNDFTAFMINSYLPNNNRIKLPEIPGNIIAHIAIAPHKNMNDRFSGV